VLERTVTPGADRQALDARMRDIEHANDEKPHEVMRRRKATSSTSRERLARSWDCSWLRRA